MAAFQKYVSMLLIGSLLHYLLLIHMGVQVWVFVHVECPMTITDVTNIRGFPYEDVFCRIPQNSIESDKSLMHELGSI